MAGSTAIRPWRSDSPGSARQQVLDTAETRLFPAVTTEPTAAASALSVPLFRLLLAAVSVDVLQAHHVVLEAAHSTLHPLAIMPAECKTSVRAASPAPGEGQRARAAVRDQPRKAVR
ncbi:MAG: hypothetical protein JWO75_838 [Actinomycetia bacterium]|jgi:hypothetical protein|nr:hypothetical protein [Actinomycetes bacterium]